MRHTLITQAPFWHLAILLDIYLINGKLLLFTQYFRLILKVRTIF